MDARATQLSVLARLKQLGAEASDHVTSIVSTWSFIFIYTLAMVIWIILHVKGFLHIDSLDFIKWNLFLSWFAGIQASVVLMSTERQSRTDRAKAEEGLGVNKSTLEVAQSTHVKIENLEFQIELLEEIIEELIHEKHEKKGTHGNA